MEEVQVIEATQCVVHIQMSLNEIKDKNPINTFSLNRSQLFDLKAFH